MRKVLLSWSMILMLVLSAFALQQSLTVDPDEAKELANEAYVFAYPMLENYRTMYVQVTERGGFNSLTHVKNLFGPHSRLIVRSNNDTLYSSAWLDLRSEPVVVEIPPVPDRYFSFQFIDMYTHNFAYAGTRVTGSDPLTIMIAGPNWEGEVPSDVEKMFVSEGNFVYCLVRTAVNSELPGDLEEVLKIQENYVLRPLSDSAGDVSPPLLDDFLLPFDQEAADSIGFIAYFNFLLGQLEIHPSERDLIYDFSRIGIGPDYPFDPSSLTEPVREAIDSGIAEARASICNPGSVLGTIRNGWTMSERIFGDRERMQGMYLVRAAAAHIGLFGNDLEEAYYPSCSVDSDGDLLDASRFNYTLSFSKEEMPPVDPRGFWSITMYDTDQMMVSNFLNRYSIGDRSELIYEEDGLLILYLQHEPPGPDKESNWLPAPDGLFTITMRIYIPAAAGLDPLYCPPAVKKSRLTD
ncbi:DUF1254 domain-containing protein [Mesotoga sp.]|uniref:DUF1254 domain-containing protein n=1 Tax=Mesotoga sp. TaxID=2053577 RepID=UPI003459C6C8